MVIKWTAMFEVDFEMEEDAPENLGATRLRTAAGELQRYLAGSSAVFKACTATLERACASA
jgi:hypothetical protein